MIYHTHEDLLSEMFSRVVAQRVSGGTTPPPHTHTNTHTHAQ